MGTTARGIWDWLATKLGRSELDHLNQHEVERLAGEVGVSVDELRQLSDRGPNAASRLGRRLQILGIDSEQLAAQAPAEYRDMQRRCALCNHHGRCGRDLSRDSQSTNWQFYCPNARTILPYQAAKLSS
jgi:hypothetical protein